MKPLIFFCFALAISLSLALSAQEVDSIIDIRDDQVYRIVKIGEQWWMMENLNIGIRINGIEETTDNGIIEKYCYDNDTNNCKVYGGLYKWNEMMDYYPSNNDNPGITRGICPIGWRLPTDEEWKELEMYLGMSKTDADGTGWRGTDEGCKMKEAGTTHWNGPNTGSTNSSGFTALPGGYRNRNGHFFGMGYGNQFWSSTEHGSDSAQYRVLSTYDSNVGRDKDGKGNGFSVRCARDIDNLSYLTVLDENLNISSLLQLYFTHDQTTHKIILFNSGIGETINIISIHTKNSAFSLDKSSSSLSPRDTIHLTITFNPPVKEIYLGA